METSRGVLLIADSGYGLTAAMTNAIRGKYRYSSIDIMYHFCRHDVAAFQRADTFILNLVQTLHCKYQEYGQILENKSILLSLGSKILRHNCMFDPLYCFDFFIREPLSKFKPKNEERLVLLIDGLEECNTLGFPYTVLNLMRYRYQSLPDWVKLIFTTKNNTVIIDYFNDLEHWHLPVNAEDNRKDIEIYWKKGNLSLYPELLHKLPLNFMLFKYALGTANETMIRIPSLVEDVHEDEINTHFGGCHTQSYKKSMIFFQIILASMEPLSLDRLFEISKFSSNDIDRENFNRSIKSILHLVQYNESDGIIYVQSHLSDWLMGNTKKECSISMNNGHALIANFMLKMFNSTYYNESDENILYDYLFHMFFHMRNAEEKNIEPIFLKLLSGIVDKQICGYTFEGFQYQPCHSVLDIFASVVNSLNLTKELLSMSTSANKTLAAINALLMNNTETFKVLIKSGNVDLSCYTNINRLKTFLNFVYNDIGEYAFQDDYTLFHLAVFKGNYPAVRLLAETNNETKLQVTGSENTAEHLAIIQDNLDIFEFLTQDSFTGPMSLRFAAHLRSYKIFKYLLDIGIHDSCITCNPFIKRKGYKDLYFLINFSSREYIFSTFAKRKYYTLLQELTCESILHHGVRTGDQVIVENILRVSTATLECKDFQGLTPLAGAMVFERPELFKLLIKNGASVEFRCKPVDVLGRLEEMKTIVNDIYTFLPSHGIEYCSSGSSIGHLIIRHSTCEAIRSLHNARLRDKIWYDVDNKNLTPFYYVLCTTDLNFWVGLFKSNVRKLILFMLASLKSTEETNKVLESLEICNDESELEIKIDSFSIMDIQNSDLCRYPGKCIPFLHDIYFNVYFERLTNELDSNFILKYLARHSRRKVIFTGETIITQFPVPRNTSLIIEVMYKKYKTNTGSSQLFSLNIVNP